MDSSLFITPKTKVLQAIEAYPQLEKVLIEFVPAFEKLKNPVLRNTVARITTLQQAAAVGKVNIEDLINRLRAEIGQDPLRETESPVSYQTEKPSWFNENNITAMLDAKPMLDAGEHPVNQVISDLKTLPAGKIYELKAPFLPAPLIDKAKSLNFEHWVVQEQGGNCTVYFHSK
ncbi:MAG TPA: DUF1858 domain-containing protein [Bacteroidales bacterium]|nr:DUF1858 domain-containing protein [Bacteroidales bacterium]